MPVIEVKRENSGIKPILKTPSSNASSDVSSHSSFSHSNSHIKFDEKTLAEHDKLRGTRTKITEPKTPYHADEVGGERDEVVSESKMFSDLSDKLLEEQMKPSLTEGEKAVKEMKHDAFEDKRKKHYDEFKKAKQWQEQDMSIDDVDNADEDIEDKEHEEFEKHRKVIDNEEFPAAKTFERKNSNTNL